MAPRNHGTQRQYAGHINVHHPRAGETILEHRVQAYDVEQVETVIGGHLIYVIQILEFVTYFEWKIAWLLVY